MNRTRKLLALRAIALAAPATLAACGDDEGGDEDPAELLRTGRGLKDRASAQIEVEPDPAA